MTQQLTMFASITDPPPAVAPWDDPATQPDPPSAATVSLFEIARRLTPENQQQLLSLAHRLEAEQERVVIEMPGDVPELVPEWLR